MLKTSRITLLAGVVLFSLAGCTKDDEDTGSPYCAPVANAGADQGVLLEDVATLDGSASTWGDEGEDCQGADQGLELTYEWTFSLVPVDSAVDEGALSDNNSTTASAPAFQPDMVGDYVLELIVCDDIGCSPSDVVVVNVTTGNPAPTADAGEDVTVQVGERVELDGSGSSDPDGEELTFDWSLNAPSCSGLESDDLYNATTANPSVICDCEGDFLVELVVSDGLSYSEPDSAILHCTGENQAPVADAGDSGNAEPCVDSTVELNGFGSYDPDGDELVYSWSVRSVPAESTVTDSSLSATDVANPSFTWDVPGDYTFQLQVFDGEEWSAPDIVTWTFVDPTVENNAPVANAGADDSVDLESECSTSSYVWTCADCEATSFEVDGSASLDPDGDDIVYTWETESDAEISSPYAYATTVEIPETEATYGTVTAHEFEIELNVADCTMEDTDIVVLTVNCEGTN